MNLRERSCKDKIKIAIFESYSNGKEQTIKPFPMHSHERESWTNHADNVSKAILHYLPNAEIHQLPFKTTALQYAIDGNFALVNVSLAIGHVHSKFAELAKKSFIVISAGNDGADGESNGAQMEDACAVGAIGTNLTPQSYSSWGKNAVKTVAIVDQKLWGLGTSFASPVVTGLLGQWYCWYYRQFDVYPNISETNDFIKMNSHDVWEDGKDPKTGYGLLRLPEQFSAKELTLKTDSPIGLMKLFRENEPTLVRNIDLNVPPIIIAERTMIGSRDVAEAFELNVIWDEASRTSKYVRGGI